MKILLVGSDGTAGAELFRHLDPSHDVKAVGLPDGFGFAGETARVDLRDPDQAKALVADREVVIHAGVFDPPRKLDSTADEAAWLEWATLGTFRLCEAARDAGVDRLIVISSLKAFEAYDERCLIDEFWKPRPQADAVSLAPHLAEMCVREFAREGPMVSVCLRLLRIGDDRELETSQARLIEAVDRAMALPFTTPGRRWRVFHVANSPRYIDREARLVLGCAFGEAK